MSDVMSAGIHAGWRSETEFLRKKNNKQIYKEKRNRAIRLRGLHIVMIFFILVSAAFLAYRIGIGILTWDKLKVKTFELVNKPLYHPEALQSILNQFNKNILTLDFSEVRNKLLALPEVKDVSLYRKLPNTLEISFILREPVFQVAIDGKFYIIDMEGMILNTISQPSNDLICIQDVSRNELDDLRPYLTELEHLKASIDFVSFRKPYGIALKLKGKPELFYPGEGQFEQKIANYYRWKELPQLRGYIITAVDLRFKDRFYFEYEENKTEVNN